MLTRLGVGFLLGLTACVSPIYSQADDNNLSMSATSDYVSEYVFRGVTLAGDAIQPGISVTYDDFTIGVWGSVPTGNEAEAFPDEINIYAFKEWDFGESIDLRLGGTIFHYPESGDLFEFDNDLANTIEGFIGIDFDLPLNPGATGYYDVDLERFTLELDFGHVITVADLFYIEPGLTLGISDATDNLDYHWATPFLEVGIDVSESASLYVRASHSSSSADTFADTSFDLSDPDTIDLPDANTSWFGVGLAANF